MSDDDNTLTFQWYTIAERDDLIEVVTRIPGWSAKATRHWNWASFGWRWRIVVSGVTEKQALQVAQTLVEMRLKRDS